MLHGLAPSAAAALTAQVQHDWLAFVHGGAPDWDMAPAWKALG